MTPDERAEFCISKCGEGYCSAMSGRGGYPCIEFICASCDHCDDISCAFCMRGEL
jgi:hypothetical protein